LTVTIVDDLEPFNGDFDALGLLATKLHQYGLIELSTK